MIKIYKWGSAPEKIKELAKANSLWYGDNEDWLLIGPIGTVDTMKELVHQLAKDNGNCKIIEEFVLGYAYHA